MLGEIRDGAMRLKSLEQNFTLTHGNDQGKKPLIIRELVIAAAAAAAAGDDDNDNENDNDNDDDDDGR